MSEITVPAVPESLLNPLTGELVPAADIAAVGEAIDALKEHRRQVEAAISAFTQAAVEQSRVHGTRTLRADGVEVVLSADSALEWDTTELVKLLDAGLPEERYRELVKETVTLSVNASVARQLEGANDAYRVIISRARTGYRKLCMRV